MTCAPKVRGETGRTNVLILPVVTRDPRIRCRGAAERPALVVDVRQGRRELSLSRADAAQLAGMAERLRKCWAASQTSAGLRGRWRLANALGARFANARSQSPQVGEVGACRCYQPGEGGLAQEGGARQPRGRHTTQPGGQHLRPPTHVRHLRPRTRHVWRLRRVRAQAGRRVGEQSAVVRSPPMATVRLSGMRWRILCAVASLKKAWGLCWFDRRAQRVLFALVTNRAIDQVAVVGSCD